MANSIRCKGLVVTALVSLAALCGRASDWVYSDGTITEVGAVGDPWVFDVTVNSADEHTLNLGQVNAQGSDELVDMKGAVTDASGTEWRIVTMQAFRNQPSATFTKFYMPDDITDIPEDGFRERPITEIQLPGNLRSVGITAFYNCSSLTSVTPLFPGTVTSIGIGAFCYAPVQGEVVFPKGAATDLENHQLSGWGTFFRCGGITSVDLSGLTITTLGTGQFEGCSSLTNVVLPPTLTTVNGAGAFWAAPNVSTVRFASLPTDIETAFGSLADYGTRFYYCPTLGDWNGFIAAQKAAGTYKTWEEDEANQGRYIEKFGPDADVPVGHFLMGSTHVWLVKYTVEVKTVNLQVTGNVLATADEGFDPVYGVYQDVQGAKTCTAPEYATLDGAVYRRKGWSLLSVLDEGSVEIDSGTDGVCVFDQTDSGTYRLVWLWEPCAYKLTLGEVDARFGSCTVTPVPDFGGTHYTSNSVVTLTATAAEGATFVKWSGDVPADIAESARIQITMDGNKTVAPVFVGPWIYSPGTVTDGDWAFDVTGSRDAIRIVEASKAGVFGTVDLTKPIADGGAFVEIATGAFFHKTGSAALKEFIMSDTVITLGDDAFRETSLERVVLSKNLKTIGITAFYYCTSLTSVTPLFPETVTSIGIGAFCYAPVQGEVVFPKGAATDLENHQLSGWGTFFRCGGITSVDLSGLTITTLGTGQFEGCSSLTNVVLPPTLTTVNGAGAFWAAPNVSTVRFASLPTDIETAFGSLADYGTRFYYCPTLGDWNGFIAAQKAAGTYKTWKEDEANQHCYIEKFGADAKKPVGNFLVGGTHVWLVKYTDPDRRPGLTILVR